MKPIDNHHADKRNAVRVSGIIVLLLGIGFMAIGLINFISAMTGFGSPDLFWCLFVGIPLLFVGVVLCGYGFMGNVARYSAGEIAPVATDTFNYVAEGTQDGVKHIASAIGNGLAGSIGTQAEASTQIRCQKCNSPTDEDSRFCPECGTAMLKTTACPSCNELNDGDAKFCDNCGQQMAKGL
jgi:RNA polymerase subunit RPABC4/transcription elongation factor Spt4